MNCHPSLRQTMPISDAGLARSGGVLIVQTADQPASPDALGGCRGSSGIPTTDLSNGRRQGSCLSLEATSAAFARRAARETDGPACAHRGKRRTENISADLSTCTSMGLVYG